MAPLNPRSHFFFSQYPGTVSINDSSNSVQHSTLLATGQVFRAHSCACIVRAVSFVARTATGAHAHARAQACCALVQRSVALASLVCGSRQEPSVTTQPLETLSRHKVFCRSTKVTLVATQAPSPSPKPCRDTKFMLRRGAKNLCRDPNRPACLGTLSQHMARKLCRACALLYRVRVPAAHSCLSRVPRPGRAPGLKTLSRHKARETLSRHNFLYRDRGPKMGNNPLWSSCTSSFPFFFSFNTP